MLQNTEAQSPHSAQQPHALSYDDDEPATTSAQDLNGWEQQANWDFQDVPLDSPRSTSSKTSKAAKQQAIHAAHTEEAPTHVAAARQELHSSNGDQHLAVLQRDNASLLQRNKLLEQVSLYLS